MTDPIEIVRRVRAENPEADADETVRLVCLELGEEPTSLSGAFVREAVSDIFKVLKASGGRVQ